MKQEILDNIYIKNSVLLKWKLIILFDIVFLIISLLLNIDILFLCSIILWMNMIIYALMDIKNRIVYASFLSTFFIFLLGGQVVYEYFNYSLPNYLGDIYYRHTNITLIISLITLQIGYLLGGKIRNQKKDFKLQKLSNERYSTTNYIVIRNISKIIFYVTSIPWIALIVEKIIYVQRTSYYDLYAMYSSEYPYFILKLAEIAPIVLFVFLATMPSKKECRIPILIYVLGSVISLATGRRLPFMTSSIFVIVYLIIRNWVNNGNEKWIGKREIIVLITLLPILIIGLYFYNFIRFGTESNVTSIFDAFLSFFQQQGYSSSLIRLGKYYQEQLSDSQWYSFYGTIKYWRTNTITNLFTDFDYGYTYKISSAAEATLGNSLARSLSYIVLGDRYLQGAGLGSSYVAEAFQDLGYIGVALANCIYGLMINTFWRINKGGVWRIAIGFILFESLLKAPRYNFDIIFTDLLNITMWMVLFGIWFLSSIITNQLKKDNIITD